MCVGIEIMSKYFNSKNEKEYNKEKFVNVRKVSRSTFVSNNSNTGLFCRLISFIISY